MYIIEAKGIQKQYGARTILSIDNFQVYEGDKIGIVGYNGAGKSTLMGILCGEILPDAGRVVRQCEAAFIRQLPERKQALSGGENAKQKILQAIQQEDTILFADEPTANLDADGVAWVQGKLLAARTVLLISHDRELLDGVCNRIVELRDGALHSYTGNYTDYRLQMDQEQAKQQQAYTDYRRKKSQLEGAVNSKDCKVDHMRQKKRADYARNGSEARLGGHKRAASIQKQEKQAKVLEARLSRLETVDKVKEEPRIAINFSLTAPPGNKLVISGEDLCFAYGEKVIFDQAAFAVKNGAKVAITGKNGAGKSTLLNLIYNGCTAIRTVPKLRLGFLHQSFENLDPDRTVLENVISTSIQDFATARGVLAGLLFRGDEVYKKAGVLSGGERLRLSLAKLISGNNNALLLDEPTNYLDISSLEAVERVLRDYPGTLLLVSHDQRFRDALCTEEMQVGDGKITATTHFAQPNQAERTLLELRQMRLLGEISSAPLEQKSQLEQEYARIVAALKAM